MSKALLAFARDLSSGALEPGKVDDGIKREIVRPDPALVLSQATGAGFADYLASLSPSAPEYSRMLAEKLALEAAIVAGGYGPVLAVAEVKPGTSGAAVVALGFYAADPTGYGRLITHGGELLAIREEKDASPSERQIDFCNAGLMALSGAHALDLLERIGNDNAKGEYYLTDAVEIARAEGHATIAAEGEAEDVAGVNSRIQLAEAEAIIQKRLRLAAMAGGATLVAPETVFFSADTELGRDVVVEPHVVFGPGVSVGNDVVIHSFCHLEGAHLESGVTIGPYARLRPGTRLDTGVRIGNFVETKAAHLERGVKVNHLSYVGDAHVGANSNLGAGTITCNYDGFTKSRTEIGAGAFIGVHSALVAPVTIGAGAYVGTGSVITDNVPDDALAIARGRQVVKPGWAPEFRDRAKQKD
ncbi:MAG: bifunctional N-acetylglucosamine-1-phosphate uridyltransferase/glucosamine-1-phosphate acetyltransferase [Xanthobacter sp. 17-67-6]|nr:MAG: bifunctional N-acetylglucosamine-1-phosphate uridyltransferase/glucosamine-1-phosphate acetyltransferase [Xanthobacter sp. 17-67-6]